MTSDRPSHDQLAKILAREISGADYAAGMRFSTESELQARFKVGRHTAREALKALTEQGLIGRRARVGTIILSKKPVASHAHTLRNLRELLDYGEQTVFDMRERGYVTPPHPGGKSRKKTWFRIAGVRKRRSDTKPLCWSEVLIPEKFVGPSIENDPDTTLFYENTLNHFSLKLEYVEQEVSAINLPKKLAAVLRAKAESPALWVQRRYIAHTAEVFEIARSIYPADRYSIESVLRQRP